VITADSPIVGRPTGSLDAALEYGGTDNAEYIREVWRLSLAAKIDPAIVIAQWAHETADGTSPRWTTNRNPAGLGIEADTDADPSTWTQTQAAVAHFWALWFLVKDIAEFIGVSPGREDDGFVIRWHNKTKDPNYPHPVLTVAHLQKRYVDKTGEPQAVWAWDERYTEKLIAKHRAIFGTDGAVPVQDGADNAQNGANVTDTLVFGNGVPYPDVVQSHLPASNPYVKTAGAPMVPDMVIWHRALGSWSGTNTWFHGGNAATMYGIAVAATDGADKAGKIYEWIEPRSGWYGESSGPAKAPYGDGALFVQEVGVHSVNRRSIAIEMMGNYNTPLDPKSRAALVALTAYWADQKGIPWHQFPIVPGTNGRSFVGWHQEICGPAEKVCPGEVVMAETPALIAQVAQVLKHYQTFSPEPKPPVYALPVLPDWWEGHLAQSWPSTADFNGLRYRALRFRAEALKGAVRRSEPSATAPKSGPNLLVREKVFVERVLQTQVAGKNGKVAWKKWYVTNDGHYLAATSLDPDAWSKPR